MMEQRRLDKKSAAVALQTLKDKVGTPIDIDDKVSLNNSVHCLVVWMSVVKW